MCVKAHTRTLEQEVEAILHYARRPDLTGLVQLLRGRWRGRLTFICTHWSCCCFSALALPEFILPCTGIRASSMANTGPDEIYAASATR